MSPLESIEQRLATALTALDSAAVFVREAQELDNKANLRHIGTAINAAWELREAIHKIQPELRPELVIEQADDPDRFERLGLIASAAYEAEKSGDLVLAVQKYQELLTESSYGHYELVAEAGLYRTQQESAR
jgi:hypothetical protein